VFPVPVDIISHLMGFNGHPQQQQQQQQQQKEAILSSPQIQ